MKTLQFKVTLLTDVIINQRAATEGNQNTLDFIPGNAFLGVAANRYAHFSSDDAFILFHSGKVRFGDAHPLVEVKRALKVPASWYKKKNDKEDKELFVHHGMPVGGLKDKGYPVQVKQYREDFIVNAGENLVSKVEIQKHFAIKSAYDREKRRSEDAKMYGYQSLQAGSEWCFEVVIDEDVNGEFEEKLLQVLEGKKRVGRSSSSQYGLVEIEKIDGTEMKFGFSKWDRPKARDINEAIVFVYAESRLIFFDKYGQPTFLPGAEQLGFGNGNVCWEMSQIRTFQYAPYNNKRQSRDADRVGIEKGSVFCITGTTSSENEDWVGSYQNEGFGKILINPDFLEFTGQYGEAKYSFTREKAKSKSTALKRTSIKTNNQPVLNYLNHQKLQKENQKYIYEKVNAFVNDNEKKFKGENFASQWGTIRSLSMQFRNPTTLKKKLYSQSESYLNHGVAAEKWNERGRISLLKEFVEVFEKKDDKGNNKAHLLSEALINLASEMAKKSRRD